MTDIYITRAAAAYRKENEMEKEMLYKILKKDNSAFHGGVGRWSLPQNNQPGKWMPPIQGELIPCENGYHLCRPKDLLDWLGPVIFEAEYQGERLDCDDKVVVREARLLQKTGWNERTARLFACDCAERVVLDVFERENPDDGRPHEAIKTARRFANGEATRQELAAASAAAETAARAAAEAIVGASARAAAWASERVAAWAAAEAAAGIAAEATVGAAAKAAERQWQQEHLLSYIQGGSG